MKNSLMEFVLILLLFTGFELSEGLEISRFKADGNDGWKRGTDLFKLPASICDQGSIASNHCGTFNASKTVGDKCSCTCPIDRATLMFYNDNQTCLDNNKVRNLLETCLRKTNFVSEGSSEPLRMLNINDERSLALPMITNLQCHGESVTSSWYIGCNGTRHPLSTNITTKSMFAFRWDSSLSRYRFKVNQGSNTDLLKGRIINVEFNCSFGSDPNSFIQFCILFKLEGKTKCSVEEPLLQTSSSTVAVLKSSSKPAAKPVTVPSVATSTQTDKPTEEGFLEIDRPSLGHEQKGDSSSSPSLGLILGVTVSALTLALFIAGVFIYRRRKSSTNRHKEIGDQDAQDTVTMSPLINSAFQPDDQTGYASIGRESTYASDYTVPEQPAETNTVTSREKKNGSWEETPRSDHLYANVNDPEPVNNSLDEPEELYSDMSHNIGDYENYSPRHKGAEHSGHLYANLNSSKGPHIYGPGKAQEPVYNNVPEDTPSWSTGEHGSGSSPEQDPDYIIVLP